MESPTGESNAPRPAPALTVVVPLYNEAAVLPAFLERLDAVLAGIEGPSEILFVDDGSSDDSVAVIEAARAVDPRIALLSLSRNFGKEAALTAGLDHAAGDAVVVIDADLQDPPELIADFVREWRAGFDVVYAVRQSRTGDSRLKVACSNAFHGLMSRLGDVEIPRDAGDFRLLSRRAVTALQSLREHHRYLKGLYAWIGFPQKALPYHREARAAGRSKWSYWRLWHFALDGVTSFSTAPLRLATWLGLVTSVGALCYATFLLLRTLLFGNPVPGYPSLIIVVLFLGGVQLICLGIIGEYLGRTYNESKDRALYFVRSWEPGEHGRDNDG